MADVNASILAALSGGNVGTVDATSGAVTEGALNPNNATAIKNIATNGALLLQNLSQLEQAFDTLLTDWGA
jgi:hypothetical protein